MEDSSVVIREQVTRALARIPGSRILADVHEGRGIPLLADYLRPIPDGWAAPPPALVNGLTLLPAFTNDDWLTIYCIEEETGRFFAIDPEAPWPPTQVFASCRDFLMDFVRVVRERQSDEEADKLAESVQARTGDWA